MIHIRNGMWETNSSTMNQIIIAAPNTTGDLYNYHRGCKIILHTRLPYEPGDMINNYAEKANIIYCLIKEIEYAYEHEYNQDEIKKYSKSLAYEKMTTMLKDVLEKNGIDAMIDTSQEWNIDPYILDNFGLSGCADNNFYKLFEDPEILERFIFDNSSYFTFGYENFWPNSRIGYTASPIPEGAIEIRI